MRTTWQNIEVNEKEREKPMEGDDDDDCT